MSKQLEDRMLSGEPFTWSQIGGTAEVDRTIQRLRKQGLITFTREGRNCVWRATGRAQVDPRDKRISDLEAALRAIFEAADNAGNEQEWADMVSAEMTDERRALVAK